jgi:hypothetical protein
MNAVALWAAAFVFLGLMGCGGAPPTDRPPITIPRDNAAEVSCAWFGDERDGVLWFGVSGFWSAMRQVGGDPRADLAIPAPRWLGRHDLGRNRTSFLTQPGGAYPTGIWDVLAHPNGQVYFTTYFDAAGVFDPVGAFEEGAGWRMLAPDTTGLNELALGPAGRILATRYDPGPQKAGSVVVLGEDGRLQAELPLENPPGYLAAAKSVAWDPVRGEIWVNTDLLPTSAGGAVAHDTRILGPGGQERLRWQAPEVQFMVFAADGTGYFAERNEDRLRLRIRPPEFAKSPLGTGRWVELDDAFPSGLDFVQEIRVAEDGRAVVTRWSGKVHIVSRSGAVQDVQLPRRDGDLFYTGVLAGDRVCATVCRTQPEPAPEAWVHCAEPADQESKNAD